MWLKSLKDLQVGSCGNLGGSVSSDPFFASALGTEGKGSRSRLDRLAKVLSCELIVVMCHVLLCVAGRARKNPGWTRLKTSPCR